jgi:hypothetical protein
MWGNVSVRYTFYTQASLAMIFYSSVKFSRRSANTYRGEVEITSSSRFHSWNT